MIQNNRKLEAYCPGCGHRFVAGAEATQEGEEAIAQCPMCAATVVLHDSGKLKELRVESENHDAVAEVVGAIAKSTSNSHPHASYERIAVFIFGVVFVIALLVLAIAFPEPTAFQYTVFRIVLALAASGVAAFVPGFLEVEVKNWVRAGGAIAVFVIIYFFTPAGLVAEAAVKPAPTDPFAIHMLESTPQGTKVNQFTFPYSDVSKKATFSEFVSILEQLPGSKYSMTDHTIFRIRDEILLAHDSEVTAVSQNNTGVLVMPTAMVNEFESKHLAFTYLWSQIQGLSLPNKQMQLTQ